MCGGARACAGVSGCARVSTGVHGCVCVLLECNNYEFSEYLLETNVFMQWPLVRILFIFFFYYFYGLFYYFEDKSVGSLN